MARLRWGSSATTPDVRVASTSGVTSWVGSVVADRASSATVAGGTAWAGAVTTTTTRVATVSGATSWVGSAITGSEPSARATGATAWVGAVEAVTDKSATVSGVLEWVGVAAGFTDFAATVTGQTLWVGAATAIHTPPVRDVTFTGFNERTRTVTFAERQRTVTFGGSMYLNRRGVEFYDPGPSSVPALAGWVCSFDQGATWLNPTATDAGRPKWLVRGPLSPADNPDANLITAQLVPMLRAVDNPEVIVENAPTIYLQR